MDGDALSVRHGNGIEVSCNDLHLHLDPTSISAETICCISHAHSDHLPRRFNKNATDLVVSSEITLRCAEGRLKRKLRRTEHPAVKMHDAGHIPGSNMFEIETDAGKVLYTGDFCPRDRPGTQGARPVKCDVLIIDSTYGRPEYVFPPTAGIVHLIRDWVQDNVDAGRSPALFAYPLGKSQELVHILDEHEPFLHSSVHQMTEIIHGCGVPYHYRNYESRNGQPCVMVCPTQAKYEVMRQNHQVVTAAVSGWAMSSSYRYQMGVDEAFVFSDHADFNDLMSFVKACGPSLVYTTHGFDNELAVEIRSRLGIEARPLLKKGQSSLLNY
ncbi:MAG: hypothetical protein A4E32_01899 [Methanomassiliicoccales archaeon PtaU1.Bin124]|nr:MAG: hypothetical protein A4E32_01899 [Methanomassiliicoccales archaeon PtaU1.Bin124]